MQIISSFHLRSDLSLLPYITTRSQNHLHRPVQLELVLTCLGAIINCTDCSSMDVFLEIAIDMFCTLCLTFSIYYYHSIYFNWMAFVHLNKGYVILCYVASIVSMNSTKLCIGRYVWPRPQWYNWAAGVSGPVELLDTVEDAVWSVWPWPIRNHWCWRAEHRFLSCSLQLWCNALFLSVF